MLGIQVDQALTDTMIEKAIVECAGMIFAGDTLRMRQSLLQSHCEHCQCVAQNMARRLGEYLGQVDRMVKAVYHYEPMEETEKPPVEKREPHVGINLVVWVERKSAALSALIEALEVALKNSQVEIGCASASAKCFALDVRFVSDREVEQARGLGVLVRNASIRSMPVWQRTDQPATTPTEVSPEPLRVILPEAFDPELIPEGRLLEHALSIESIPPQERGALEHHLTELKVILIRRIISDQLAYINIAKRWFQVRDLAEIHRRKIGLGRIGGKAAGMMLAARILNERGDDALRATFSIPESFFLGSDVMYIFLAMNGLQYWTDQKYKPEEQIWDEYPRLKAEFEAGKFPPEILVELRGLLESVGNKPLIVRSSSQLEDSFGTAFAGKYDSHFCPNQGTLEENLNALTLAIARTFGSTLKPEALLYRRSRGLQDYDERMAILIQVVQGDPYGRYYLPHGAGVAFSHNLYRWNPQIRQEDGFVRLVWGLGTRAVERVGNDYPRPVALSHPTLLPNDSAATIRYYSQQYVDLIDLQENSFKSLPVKEVLRPSYPVLRFIAQIDRGGYLATPRSRVWADEVSELVITFDELLCCTPFAATLSKMLRLLEENYHSAVDMEFTVHIPNPFALPPQVQITLLQCRPQSLLKETTPGKIPAHLESEDIIFSTRFMVPRGLVANIRYVLFVPPEAYYTLETVQARKNLSSVISQINTALPEKSFICVGPGRWGSLNTDLGVYICYSDIYNTGALVEISGKGMGVAPEPSLGTHFFQDLMEAQIFPLAVNLDETDVTFQRDFFYDTPNRLTDWVRCGEATCKAVRLIAIADYRSGYHLDLAMDDAVGLAVAYLSADQQVDSMRDG
ncbi:MAG: PEP/pyruvate-binding domain-containing protein [Anaerolineales bacterium]|nr:PEP/pyruvate-binding domain-containing protein [Anaerolineales bacterium]